MRVNCWADLIGGRRQLANGNWQMSNSIGQLPDLFEGGFCWIVFGNICVGNLSARICLAPIVSQDPKPKLSSYHPIHAFARLHNHRITKEDTSNTRQSNHSIKLTLYLLLPLLFLNHIPFLHFLSISFLPL